MPHRIVLLHGFTQTGRCWGGLDEHLRARGREVACPDLPGHGTGAAAAERADVPETAAQLAAAAAPGGGVWLGYSFGARVALHVALDQPEVVHGLVLVSGTAGLDAPADRAARVAADEALADDLERVGVATFLDRWLALPLFAALTPADHDRVERETSSAAGLAASLRLAGTGTMTPRWADLPRLDVPVLLVAGERDPKFVTAAERMAGAIPAAQLAVVTGAGHTVHREQPAAFRAVLDEWLARVDPVGGAAAG